MPEAGRGLVAAYRRAARDAGCTSRVYMAADAAEARRKAVALLLDKSIQSEDELGKQRDVLMIEARKLEGEFERLQGEARAAIRAQLARFTRASSSNSTSAGSDSTKPRMVIHNSTCATGLRVTTSENSQAATMAMVAAEISTA